MRPRHFFGFVRPSAVAAFALVCAAAGATSAHAQPPPSERPSLEIYGFGMVDAIADFNQVNPDWYDSARPSRLPKVANEFGEDGRFSLSPRQSRFGVRAEIPTPNGDVKGNFEFDMYGTGKDAGLATIRLRHAWGQWKSIGGGYTNSAFMDVDVFPNTLEYWGPNGMLFLRNSQVFYEPFNDGKSNARIAVEAPGASGDLGLVADRIELQNVKPRFPRPDFTGHYRWGQDWGYVQVGGALRYFAYDDLIPNDQFALSGHNWGWGVSLSSNYKPTPKDVLRFQIIQGAGVENYFNDAPIDIGVESNPGNPVTPVVGKPLGDFGLVLYLDHTWNDRFTSAIGYTRVDISNSNGQTPDAFKSGQYLSGNLLVTPAPNVLMGGEFVWIHRENFSDGFGVSDFRLQFSFKVNFSVKVGG
jgi:hypothetical protein